MRPWPCCLASQTSQRVNARQRERGLEHQRTAGFQHIHNSHSQTASINKVVWAPFSLSTLPGQLTLYFKYNEAIRRMIDNAVAGELLGRRRRRRSRGWPDRNTGLAESSFKHWRGGEAMRQTRLSNSTETGTGPSCSRILGFAGGGAHLDTSRSIAQPHRILDLHNGPLSVENWRCLETQAYYQYCMTSKNVLVLIKFLSMTTLFALLNHSVLVCLIP
jgi:hypothetical protein